MRDGAVTVHGVKKKEKKQMKVCSLQLPSKLLMCVNISFFFLPRGKIVFSNIYAVIDRAISPGMVRCGRDIFVFLTHNVTRTVIMFPGLDGMGAPRWFLYI